MTTVDLLRQHSNVFYGSGFGESIKRRVVSERSDETQVEDGVAERRHDGVDGGEKEEEIESGDILGRAERHVGVNGKRRR